MRYSAAVHCRRAPRGVTLVELLIVTTIIAILASLVMFAMATAQESARADRTRALIGTLHSVVMEEYDSYRTRRVPVTIAATDSPTQAATKRLNGIRRLMLHELPDRWSDVATLPTDPEWRTAKLLAYNSYYNRFSSHAEINTHQSAECLYMIVSLGGSEVRSLLSATNIGDKDGDGAMEFHDGWGNPINFIRWPAGSIPNIVPGYFSDLQTGDPIADHDPFDFLNLQMVEDPANNKYAAYRLVPLIYSAGPDGGFDIVHNGTGTIDNVNPNPYRLVGNSGNQKKLGTPYDDTNADTPGKEEWHDNIHNHMMGVR